MAKSLYSKTEQRAWDIILEYAYRGQELCYPIALAKAIAEETRKQEVGPTRYRLF